MSTKAILRSVAEQICFSKTHMQLKAAKSARAKNVFLSYLPNHS